MEILFQIISKQRNEGLYLLDWISWHIATGIKHFHITSNDCSDSSDELLKTIKFETNYISLHKFTLETLNKQSIGESALLIFNEIVAKNKNVFFCCLDIDEYLCFVNQKTINISTLNFVKNSVYELPWLNCVQENSFYDSQQPVYHRNTHAITKKNNVFPYLNGYRGKQLRFNDNGVSLGNFHHFSVNGEEIKKGETSGIYLKHCVVNSLEEFMIRSDRGQASSFRETGQNQREREKANYKYAIDLYLMYISQETMPNILPNKVIADKAAEIKSELLSNPKIKAAQDKIDAYYKRKFAKIKKSYIPSIFRELNIRHIDDLKTRELEKFNKQFFSSKSKKPHDYYVLMSLTNLFEKNHEKARQYATEGLMIYPSFKLLLMAQSSILQNPYYAVP